MVISAVVVFLAFWILYNETMFLFIDKELKRAIFRMCKLASGFHTKGHIGRSIENPEKQ